MYKIFVGNHRNSYTENRTQININTQPASLHVRLDYSVACVSYQINSMFDLVEKLWYQRLLDSEILMS